MFVYELSGCGFESRCCHSFQTFGVVYLYFNLVVILSWIHDLNLILVTTSQFDMFKINNINTRTTCETCSQLTIKTPEGRHWCFCFLSGFFSQTLTFHRTAGEGRGPSFIPLFHFHPLTNIETFICNFACEMTITYF